MKKALYFVFGLIVGILIITVLPNISNGEAEAKGNDSEIVGSWVATSFSNMFQFNEDGTGVYYNPTYSYVFTRFTYSYDSDKGIIRINADYSTEIDGEKYKLVNEECSISICGNGMIIFNPFERGPQVNKPYAFTRA